MEGGRDKAASGPNKLNLYLDLRTSVQYVELLPERAIGLTGERKKHKGRLRETRQ